LPWRASRTLREHPSQAGRPSSSSMADDDRVAGAPIVNNIDTTPLVDLLTVIGHPGALHLARCEHELPVVAPAGWDLHAVAERSQGFVPPSGSSLARSGTGGFSATATGGWPSVQGHSCKNLL
jgi:hypothetical protein